MSAKREQIRFSKSRSRAIWTFRLALHAPMMHVRCLILRVAESIPDDVEVLRCIDRAEEHVVVALQHKAVTMFDLK